MDSAFSLPPARCRLLGVLGEFVFFAAARDWAAWMGGGVWVYDWMQALIRDRSCCTRCSWCRSSPPLRRKRYDAPSLPSMSIRLGRVLDGSTVTRGASPTRTTSPAQHEVGKHIMMYAVKSYFAYACRCLSQHSRIYMDVYVVNRSLHRFFRTQSCRIHQDRPMRHT